MRFMFIYVLTISLVAAQLNSKLLQGFSMVPLYYRDKIVLVAFGGNKKEPSDKVKELNFIAKWKLHFCDIISGLIILFSHFINRNTRNISVINFSIDKLTLLCVFEG